MTTLCRIVLAVVTCTVDPSTPKPTPAEAVAIFAASAGPWRVGASAPDGWQWDSPAPLVDYDREWPFTGAFAPTWAPAAQRLDGTSLFDPPTVYGAPPFARHGYGRGYGYGSERIQGHSGRVYQGSAGRPWRGTPGDVRSAGRNGPVRAGEDRASGGARRVGAAPRAPGGPDRPIPQAGVTSAPVRRR